MAPEPLEFAYRRGWNTLPIMGALLFVGTGAWLLLRRESDDRTRRIALGCVLFFGACAWIFVREDVRPRPRLRLDASGLDVRRPKPGAGFRFEWRAVASVAVRHEERASLVVVTLRASAGAEAEAVPDPMAARGFSPAMLPSEVVLSPAEFGIDANGLASEIERFRRDYESAPPPVGREEMM